MACITVLTGGLTAAVELFTVLIALGHQIFTLLGIGIHFLNRLLQYLSSGGEIFLFAYLLLLNFGKFFFSAFFTGL